MKHFKRFFSALLVAIMAASLIQGNTPLAAAENPSMQTIAADELTSDLAATDEATEAGADEITEEDSIDEQQDANADTQPAAEEAEEEAVTTPDTQNEASSFTFGHRKTWHVHFITDTTTHYSTVISAGGYLPALPGPNKPGYTFLGWYTSGPYGKRWNFASDRMPNADLLLFARWEQTITYPPYPPTEPDYSRFVNFLVDSQLYRAIPVVPGEMIPAPIPPKKLGLYFRGWYTEPTGGIRWDFARLSMPNKDLILYAQWVQL